MRRPSSDHRRLHHSRGVWTTRFGGGSAFPTVFTTTVNAVEAVEAFRESRSGARWCSHDFRVLFEVSVYRLSSPQPQYRPAQENAPAFFSPGCCDGAGRASRPRFRPADGDCTGGRLVQSRDTAVCLAPCSPARFPDLFIAASTTAVAEFSEAAAPAYWVVAGDDRSPVSASVDGDGRYRTSDGYRSKQVIIAATPMIRTGRRSAPRRRGCARAPG